MTAFIKSRISSRAIGILLALILLVSVMAGRENGSPAVAALASSTRTASPAADPALDLDLEQLQRASHGGAARDLFAARRPPAPLAPGAPGVTESPGNVEPAEPPPPSAPALPFTYLGQYIDGDRAEIFVARDGEHYTVERGKIIDGGYKVEKISNSAVTFVHLASGTRQQLAIPALQ